MPLNGWLRNFPGTRQWQPQMTDKLSLTTLSETSPLLALLLESVFIRKGKIKKKKGNLVLKHLLPYEGRPEGATGGPHFFVSL